MWLVAQAKRFTRCGPKANDSAALSGSDWRTGELGNWLTQASRAVKLNLVGDRWRTPKLRELNNWRPRRPDYPATGGRPSTRNSRTVPVDQLGIQAREMPEDWPNCTSPELRQLLAPTDPRSSSLSVSQLKNSRTAARDWQFARRLEAGSNWPNCTSPELRQLLAPTDPRSSSLSVSQLKNSRTAARDWQFARRLEAGSNWPNCTSPELRQLLAPTDPPSPSRPADADAIRAAVRGENSHPPTRARRAPPSSRRTTRRPRRNRSPRSSPQGCPTAASASSPESKTRE